ncbi:hypothetical protein ACJX0J_040123, partial [Zea mays]
DGYYLGALEFSHGYFLILGIEIHSINIYLKYRNFHAAGWHGELVGIDYTGMFGSRIQNALCMPFLLIFSSDQEWDRSHNASQYLYA